MKQVNIVLTLILTSALSRREVSLEISIACIIAVIIEAARNSEKSVNFYQTTRHNIPEDSNYHSRRRENLKSHLVELSLPKQREYLKDQINEHETNGRLHF
jgi:hypothetical protein